MNETWVYHYDRKLQQPTLEWTVKPQNNQRYKSSKKVMTSVFWNAKGILLIDYLQTGKTIVGKYYSNLLDRLKQKLKKRDLA